MSDITISEEDLDTLMRFAVLRDYMEGYLDIMLDPAGLRESEIPEFEECMLGLLGDKYDDYLTKIRPTLVRLGEQSEKIKKQRIEFEKDYSRYKT
jgi:hypothetical protein